MSLLFGYDLDNEKSWKGRPTENLLVTTNWGGAYCMGRSDKRPFNATSHSSRALVDLDSGWSTAKGDALNTVEKPDGIEDCEVWYVKNSNPDNYSRFSPYNGFDLEELDEWNISYVISVYLYIPYGTILGNSLDNIVVQNSTGTDWHTASSGDSATYNATYGYWSHNIETSENRADGNIRGEWQRLWTTFIPDSDIKVTDSAGVNIDRLGGYFRPNMVGQSDSCFMYIAAAQLEKGTYPSKFTYGSRSAAESLIDLADLNSYTIPSNMLYDSNDQFYFDGSTNLIYPDTNYPTSWSDPISYEVWHYVATGETWYGGQGSGTAILGRGSYHGSHGLFHNTTDNYVRMFWRDSTDYNGPSALCTRDKWQHIVGTWDGSVTKIYIDGELQASETHDGTFHNVPDPGGWKIGGDVAFGGNNGLYMEGKVPFLKVYDHALTASEVKSKFEMKRKGFGV